MVVIHLHSCTRQLYSILGLRLQSLPFSTNDSPEQLHREQRGRAQVLTLEGLREVCDKFTGCKFVSFSAKRG